MSIPTARMLARRATIARNASVRRGFPNMLYLIVFGAFGALLGASAFDAARDALRRRNRPNIAGDWGRGR